MISKEEVLNYLEEMKNMEMKLKKFYLEIVDKIKKEKYKKELKKMILEEQDHLEKILYLEKLIQKL